MSCWSLLFSLRGSLQSREHSEGKNQRLTHARTHEHNQGSILEYRARRRPSTYFGQGYARHPLIAKYKGTPNTRCDTQRRRRRRRRITRTDTSALSNQKNRPDPLLCLTSGGLCQDQRKILKVKRVRKKKRRRTDTRDCRRLRLRDSSL